ncbi:MAG: hypothetical protein LW627_06635 [Ilumatobacteraceae bacterium]|nr:hypothetical protein [Ilumatobacteraceae bacterium]
METTSSTNDRGAFWHRSNTSRRGALFAVLLLATLATVWTSVVGDRAAAASGPSADLEQCANGGTTCDTSHAANWQTGNLNSSNSDYTEGESVPYRSLIDGLSVGATYAVTISWKSSSDGRKTLDYITSFDRTETTADPCAGSACSGSPVTLSIPPNASLGIPQAAGNISLWGGAFTVAGATVANTGDLCVGATCVIASNPTAYSMTGTLATTSTISMRVLFTASATSAVLAWGGHIASQVDWGVGQAAGAVNGASYHMYFTELECSNLNCNVGQEDRSMLTSAVTVPGSITIEKNASVKGSTIFGFTASPAPLTSFDLVDDGSIGDPDSTPASRTFAGIVDFTTYTVTESSTSLWSLTNLACTVLAPNGGTQTVDGSSVVIDLREGEMVTCVYSNARDPQPAIDLAKSAAPGTYSASGDVITYTYTIDNAEDVTSGSVKNTATAHAGELSSSPAAATVTFVAVTTTTSPATTTTVTATTVVEQEVTTTVPVTTTVAETCITIPREPAENASTPETGVNPAAVNGDPCVVATTVPGTIVLTGVTTTPPTVQPTTTSAPLPSTGSDPEPSSRTIALIILVGASLLLLSRRQVRRTVTNQDPS